MITKLLRKNTSPARIAGFVLSNFIGIAIVLGALQFYLDAKSIWLAEDSFISKDYLVINKKVTSANTMGRKNSGFSEEEIADIESQPWTRRVGRFTANDFKVYASLENGGRSMSTYMFFEAIPDEFIDVPKSQWTYAVGDKEVPVILSKDYLTLYNFGFAASNGMPQLTENLMGSIPLHLTMISENGTKRMELDGRIAGFSNRLNTILVPHAFLDNANKALGSDSVKQPSRLIIDTSSPGDVAIENYLNEHNLEVAGDKSASSAAFMLKIITGIILAIGITITLLSFFILMLSISLIMEKNKSKIHSLLMLGYRIKTISKPYVTLIIAASTAALLLAFVGLWAMRAYYIESVVAMGAKPELVWLTPVVGLGMTALIIVFNILTVKRRILSAFRF